MNFSKRFIDRPIATSMLMLALVMLGIAAYPFLPVSSVPRVDFPTIQVSAKYPGASAETVAAQIAAPLERQFSQVSGITQMTSTSSAGSTQVTLQFELGRNLDGAAQDVQAAINAASGQLPRDLPSAPSYRKYNPADSPILILAVTSDTLPLMAVNDAADNILVQQISRIDGVGDVNLSGEQKPAMRVEINPDKLAAMGLGFEDVRTALATASVERPKGSLNDTHQSYTIDANDQLKTAVEYNNIIVATNSGVPARISDIGQAIEGPENTRIAAWYNGEPALVLAISRQPGADVIATVDRIKAALPRLEQAMPRGVKVNVVVDRTESIRASVREVSLTLVLSVGLVITVIFIFLRTFWGTIIPSITVPVAIIGTFGVMYLLDYSIDNLSLMGLTIAVGFVVDDAIVMLENIERHMRDGMTAYEAAVIGAGEIGFTIVSISISLIAVFIPLLLMSGYVGALFREFAVTVCAAVVISLFVSLTLTPMMGARLLRHGGGQRRGFYTALEIFFDGILARYERSLRWVLRHQGWTIAAFGITFVLTIVLFLSISKGFFPEQDTGNMDANIDAAPEIAFGGMVEKHHQAVEIISKDKGVAKVASSAGSGSGQGAANSARIYISLKPRDEREDSAQEIIARLRPKLAAIVGARAFVQARQDIRIGARQSKALYQYTLNSTDQDELNEWAPKALARLRTLAIIADVTSDQDQLMPQIELAINRDSASRLGVSTAVIDETLSDAFAQRQVGTIFNSVNQYHVMMGVDSREPIGPDVLRRIHVKSASGLMVPLSAVASFERTAAPSSINHQDLFPSVTISFNLSPGASLGDAVNAITQAMTELGAPATLQGSFQGTAQAFQSSLASVPLLILAALVAIYVVLAILYESLVHPITILSTLPSAGVGGLFMLFIFGQDFTVMALIGIILLMGIVKKNGIMLVDFALQAERDRNLSPDEAIYEACVKRFRPILMTTVATLMTGIPLAIGFGAGAELRQPLGLTIVGGLLFSQAMTLYTTPVIYLALDRFRLRASRLWRTWFSGGENMNVPLTPAAHEIEHKPAMHSAE